jgi:hypothetical protein
VFSDADRLRRDEVLARIAECVRTNQTIKLPPFDPSRSLEGASFALQAIEPNDFSGTLGAYRYQFEGEEDLLHLIVLRSDGSPLTAEEGQTVAGFLLEGLPSALIWLKPGTLSQHFYFGHDELLAVLES